MKKFLLLSLLSAGVASAATITTTNAPNVGSVQSVRKALNDSLLVVSNVFDTVDVKKTVSTVDVTNNYPLTSGDYTYLISCTSTGFASVTNLVLPTPSRAGQTLDIINIYTGAVTISRVSGNASALYPVNVTNITLVAGGGSAQFIAPSTTNWVLRDNVTAP